MRTEYQISGSTPVTFRENGALHEMVTELAFLASTFTPPTVDSWPGCNLYAFSIETVDYNHNFENKYLTSTPSCMCVQEQISRWYNSDLTIHLKLISKYTGQLSKCDLDPVHKEIVIIHHVSPQYIRASGWTTDKVPPLSIQLLVSCTCHMIGSCSSSPEEVVHASSLASCAP